MSYLGGICVLFVFENLLAIVFLMLGAVFLDDCPIDPSIPISLLVVGVVSMIHAVVIQFIPSLEMDWYKGQEGRIRHLCTSGALNHFHHIFGGIHLG